MGLYHSCEVKGCETQTYNYYCSKHTCKYYDCDRLALNRDFCSGHECKIETCTHKKINIYCYGHTCRYRLCTLRTVPGSIHCKLHKQNIE